jgi:Spy/CpxP family protein refolding chaperone
MLRNIKILRWLIFLLLLMNMVTIGTIVYHQYQEKKMAGDIRISTPSGTNLLNGRYCRQELGFTAEQMDEFRSINQQFRPATMELTWRIDSLKEEMYDQLTGPAADTASLNRLSAEIGELHGRLKYETYRFYIQLKEISNKDQQVKLANAFKPLFKNETVSAPGLHRQGPGWKRNQP